MEVRLAPVDKNVDKKPDVYLAKEKKGSIPNNGRALKYGRYIAPNQVRHARLAIIEKPVQYVPIKINRVAI